MLRERGVLRSRREAGLISHPNRVQAEPECKAPAPEVREILPSEVAEEVLRRYGAGEVPRVIGLVLGVPANRVYRLLRALGVLRSRSEAREVREARHRAAQET